MKRTTGACLQAPVVAFVKKAELCGRIALRFPGKRESSAFISSFFLSKSETMFRI